MPYSPELLLRLLQRFTNKWYQNKQIQALIVTSGHLHFNPLDTSKFKWMSTLLFNALIRSYLVNDQATRTLSLFTHMLRHQVPPNNFTFPSIVKAASSCFASPSFASTVGRTLHSQATRRGLLSDPYVRTSFISFYGKLRLLVDAQLVFDEILEPCTVSSNSMIDAFGENGEMELAASLFESMFKRDIYTWTSMINGFGQNACHKEAVGFFTRMMAHEDVTPSRVLRPNEATFVTALASCAHMGALCQGKQIHGYMIKNELSDFMETALISFYGKLGCLTNSYKVFNQIKSKKVCVWNAVISSFASNGGEKQALEMFHRMKREKVSPNGVTFVGVLTACSRGKHVELGLELFNSMARDFGIAPKMEHYGCVVDLLGRAGLLDEADHFIKRMPFDPDDSVLGALLGACKAHGAIQQGLQVGTRLQSGRYVTLSSMNASAEKWGPAFDFRTTMLHAGMHKIPAYSLIHPS